MVVVIFHQQARKLYESLKILYKIGLYWKKEMTKKPWCASTDQVSIWKIAFFLLSVLILCLWRWNFVFVNHVPCYLLFLNWHLGSPAMNAFIRYLFSAGIEPDWDHVSLLDWKPLFVPNVNPLDEFCLWFHPLCILFISLCYGVHQGAGLDARLSGKFTVTSSSWCL